MSTNTATLASRLRAWLQTEMSSGVPAGTAMLNASVTVNGVMQDFMIANDIAGVRYWFHPESESYFATQPNESLAFLETTEVHEVTREEFLKANEL